MAANRRFEEDELSISFSPSQILRAKRGEAADGTSTSGDKGGEHKSGRRPRQGDDGQTHEHREHRKEMDPLEPHDVGADTAPHQERDRLRQRVGQYNIVKTLGEGSFGKVKLAVHRSTGQQVALKIIARKKLISRDMQGRVEREIEYLQLLRHPHIIKLYTVIKTPTEIIMVLEYAGGELFDYIVQHGKMKEDEARRFFQQMLCAVEYCHRHKIVHRDLKPENLLLDESLNVKIADFGLSNIMTDGNFLKTSCGSPNYAAPEVIGGKLYAGPEVDVWSCGVILYVLLVGRLPFDDEHIPSLFAKIARGTYVVPTWMSPGAAALIKKMLVVNPVSRATIDDIRQDPWFMQDLPAYLQPPVEEFRNTGVDPNKAISVSDIAPGAPVKVQEKLHAEVTDKISKTMGYGRRDVQEALEAEEPSAIKDAYMIVRENKMMQVNPTLGAGTENPYFATSPPGAEDGAAAATAGMSSLHTEDSGASPLASLSSARSTAATVPGTSPRIYVSKVGILPSSLPAYHRDFMERESRERENEGTDDSAAQASAVAAEALLPSRSPAVQEATARRLKPHQRPPMRLDEAAQRPSGLTPVTPAAKKPKPVRWQFGIRSRNAPWDALVCIYKALHKLGAEWEADEDYEKVHGPEDRSDSPGGDGSFASGDSDRARRNKLSLSMAEILKSYRLPAEPWRIKVRWETRSKFYQLVTSQLDETKEIDIEAPELARKSTASLTDKASVTRKDDGEVLDVVAMRMDIQIYEMERGAYLVDFKCDGYETPDARLLEEKEVTSPFPFLDMAAMLIMQLADAD
jgi:carbon catabolite-derepressing protein kinase